MIERTLENLSELLSYDANTGIFTWKVSRRSHGGKAKAGAPAGYLAPDGYCILNVGPGSPMKAHRVAWLFAHGEWPTAEIDHVNRDRSDNRIANLRLANRSQNSANMVKPVGKSGFKGVYQMKGQRRWFAQISVASRSKSLGTFDTPEEAHAAYVAAARQHYGEFARTE